MTITLTQLREHLDRQTGDKIVRMIGRFTMRQAAAAETRAKQINGQKLNAPSGRLQGSIRATPKIQKGKISVTLAAGGGRQDVKYAKVHEQQGYPGTYFIIRPRTATYLKFPVSTDAFTPVGVSRGTGGSGWVSTKEVRIPSRPFLRPAFEEMESKLIPVVRELIKNEVLTRG